MEIEKNGKKETLFSVLKENDENKIQEYLLRNGKKKSYSPICFNRDKTEIGYDVLSPF